MSTTPLAVTRMRPFKAWRTQELSTLEMLMRLLLRARSPQTVSERVGAGRWSPVGFASLAVSAALWMFAANAQAQTDPYESITMTCANELERVEVAIEEEDLGRAMVLMDMAGEPCDNARAALLETAGDDTEHAALLSLWTLELNRVQMYERAGMCDEARSTLQRVAALTQLPGGVHGAFAPIAHSALACGPRPGVATSGMLVASSGMSDQTVSGTTTGVRSAAELYFDAWGFIPLSPTYSLEVDDSTHLSISAYSYGGDLVMLVMGPGGNYFNDDHDGLNPAIEGEFLAGIYEIYIGEYSSSGYPQEFSMTLTTTPLYVSSPSYVYPTYGSASVGPGYARTTLSGTAWGYNDASLTFDASCSGWVAENPDFQVYVDTTSETWITVTGSVGTDLTLIVDGPSGRYCNDDSMGTNPVVHETLMAGTYNVWVGDNAGSSTGASYGVQFSSYDPMMALETTPAFGEVRLGPPGGTAPSSAAQSGLVQGIIPASDFFGSSCYGNIAAAPSHRLIVEADGMYEVVARDTSAFGDLIIAISGPAGTFCNDDYEGLNPGVRRWLTAGDYTVYVGELGSSAGGTPFTTTFTATMGTPPPDLTSMTSGVHGSVTVGTSYGATTMSGSSGGPNRADEIDTSCRGWITAEPTFLMDLVDYSYVTMNVMAEGDTTLVIVGPDGVYCNDDFMGLNPGYSEYFSPGRYGVWVGSYAAGQVHPFMMTFSPDW